MSFCAFSGCTNVFGRFSDVTFHSFPSGKPELLKEWLNAINKPNWKPMRTSRVCSEHFTPDSFIECKGLDTRTLKPNAVPTISKDGVPLSSPKGRLKQTNVAKKHSSSSVPKDNVIAVSEEDSVKESSRVPDPATVDVSYTKVPPQAMKVKKTLQTDPSRLYRAIVAKPMPPTPLPPTPPAIISTPSKECSDTVDSVSSIINNLNVQITKPLKLIVVKYKHSDKETEIPKPKIFSIKKTSGGDSAASQTGVHDESELYLDFIKMYASSLQTKKDKDTCKSKADVGSPKPNVSTEITTPFNFVVRTVPQANQVLTHVPAFIVQPTPNPSPAPVLTVTPSNPTFSVLTNPPAVPNFSRPMTNPKPLSKTDPTWQHYNQKFGDALRDIRRKVKVLQQSVRRKTRLITKYKNTIHELRQQVNGSKGPDLLQLIDTQYSGLSKELLSCLVKNQSGQRRYNDSIKEFASTLHSISPKAYKYVKFFFDLPHPKSLKRKKRPKTESSQENALSENLPVGVVEGTPEGIFTLDGITFDEQQLVHQIDLPSSNELVKTEMDGNLIEMTFDQFEDVEETEEPVEEDIIDDDFLDDLEDDELLDDDPEEEDL